MNDCSYDLRNQCKEDIEVWVLKKHDTFSEYWFALCRKHFKIICKESKITLKELQFERIRQIELKSLGKKNIINWKMFLDWEELGYHGDIHNCDNSYGDINITIALEKHRKNNLQRYIKRIDERYDPT